MALPGNVSTGTVTGTFIGSDGAPARGTVRFTAEAPYVLDGDADAILVSLTHTAELDVAGSFTVELVATDDANLLPVDFTYRVQPRVYGLTMPAFSIEVPSGSDQDLADIAPASGTGGTLPEGPLDPAVADLVPGPSLTHDALVTLIEDTAPGGGGGGAVDSVNGHTGVVVLVKSDVGLSNVDNTSDASKPVSTATSTALAGKASTSHTHAQSDVTSLVSDLAGKAATSHTHASSDVTSGTLAVARIGSGTAAAGKYVDGGTGAWTTLPAGGGTAPAPFVHYPLSEYGMFTAAIDPSETTDTSSLSPGLVRLPIPAGWTIDGVKYAVQTADTESSLNGFAIYEDGSPSTLAGNTTGTVWAVTGLRSLALATPIAAQSNARVVTLAFTANPASALQVRWKSGTSAFWANSGTRRRSVYGLSFGSSWPSTFDFTTGGTENAWLPLFGLYGTKV